MQKMKILIIDDSSEDRVIYRRFLEKDPAHEYIFLEADSGEMGLELYQSENPDCILLDYNLPDYTGLEFIKQLTDENGKIAVAIVIITGMANEFIAVEALKRGVRDYLVKDIIHAEALQKAIGNAIDKTSLQRKVEKQRIELEQKVRELQEALTHVKQLQGLLPICMWCKKIRDDKNSWLQIEEYISQHSEVEFSHSLCQECKEKHYPEIANRQKANEE
jgi:CheY-like chemotaxis protein